MSAKKTILCVDDEQSLSIHKVTLETRGYRVLTCHSAADAFASLGQGGVDMVLSGANLPDSSATDLVEQIKTLSPDIPVILLAVQMRAVPMDASADLVLRMGSFTPAELLERIRTLLTRRRGPRRATVESTVRRVRA